MTCALFVFLFLFSFFSTLTPVSADFVCAGFESSETVHAQAAAKPLSSISSIGAVNALVISAKFKGEDPDNQRAPDYIDKLFDPNLPGSLTHFYATMSFGQFHLNGTVLPKRYSSEQSSADYLADEPGGMGHYDRFVIEILRQVDAEVNFVQFDNDGPDGVPNSGDDDGVVDYIFVNVLSTPRDFLISGATGIAGLGLDEIYDTRDLGVGGEPIQIIASVALGAVLREGTFAQTAGVMAHEFGHAFGLPDLYDSQSSGPQDDSAGIGHWGLMGSGATGWNGNDGPNPFCAWSREELGWLGLANGQLVEVAEDATGLDVEALDENGVVYLIPLVGEFRTGTFNSREEYLLLERVARQSTYYHRNLPGEGVLVWYVRPQIRDNADEHSKGVDLICADGLYRDAGYPAGQVADGQYGGDNLDFWAHDGSYSRDHAGNQGDATDPFDGEHFTHFGLTSNPSNHIRDFVSNASSSVDFILKRRGESMQLDVRQPRWAGTIDTEVVWHRTVLVEGDVRVAPLGRLIIVPGTQVFFAGQDRLQSGLDPALCELDIQGDLLLTSRSQSGRALFAPMRQGESWYGISIDPGDSSLINISNGSYEVRDSQRGFFFPQAPVEIAEETVQRQYALLDHFGAQTVGNGDGQLNPGEIFQLQVVLDNWTLLKYRLDIQLDWDSELVTPAWKIPTLESHNVSLEDELDLLIGAHEDMRLPSLYLSPAAAAGQTIDFEMTLQDRSKSWQQKLSFIVAGQGESSEVTFAVPDYAIKEGAIVAQVERPVEIEVEVGDEVERVELMLRSVPQLAPVAQIDMAKVSATGGTGVFSASFRPPQPGWYRGFARLHRRDGSVVLSEISLDIWALHSAQHPPTLAILGPPYSEEEKGSLQRQLDELVRDSGRTAIILDREGVEDAVFSELLQQYMHVGNELLWLGDVPSELETGLRAMVENGGHLGLIAEQVRLRTQARAEILHVRRTIRQRESKIRSPGFLGSGTFFAQPVELDVNYRSLDLLESAQILMVDEEGRPVALRVRNGDTRLAYLGFDLDRVEEADVQNLLQSLLDFWGRDFVGETVLEVVDGADAQGELLVRAEVAGALGGVDLMVRAYPRLELLAEVPMQQVATVDGKQVFEAALQPSELGHYQLSLRPYDGEGEVLLSDATWRGVGIATQRQVLVFLGQQYKEEKKKGLRTEIGKTLGAMGLSVAFVDVLNEETESIEGVLEHFSDPGEAVLWMGQFIDGKMEDEFTRFLEGGGRAFFFSSNTSSSPAFRNRFLYSSSSRGVPSPRSLDIQSLHLNENLKFASAHVVLDLLPPAELILLDQQHQAAGLQVNADTFRVVYLPFHLNEISEEVYSPLIRAGMGFLLQEEAPPLAIEVPDYPLVDQMLVLEMGQEARVRVRLEGKVERGDLQVRSLTQRQLLQVLPLQPVVGQEQVYEAVFRSPQAGRYQLVPQFYNSANLPLHSSAYLDVFSVPEPQAALVLLGADYAAEDQPALRAALDQVLHSRGLAASYVRLFSQDPLIYETVLERHLEKGRLVIWIGEKISLEVQAVFERFMRGGGNFLVISRQLALVRKQDEFHQDIFHIENSRQAKRQKIRALGPEQDFTFNVAHVFLELLTPALPVLFDEQDEVAGLRVDTGVYRLVYYPFKLREVIESAYQPLFEQALDFLLQQEALPMKIEVPDQPLVGENLVLDEDRATQVRVRIEGEVARGELQVYSLPLRELLAVLPLEQSAAEEQVYEVVFQPPGVGSYQLEPQFYSAAGKPLYSIDYLRAIGVPGRQPVLVFLGDQYGDEDKERIKELLDLSFASLGLEAVYVERLGDDAAVYEALLTHYLDPGDVVIWVGEGFKEEISMIFRQFAQRGGELFFISSSPQVLAADFGKDVLHVTKLISTSINELYPIIQTASNSFSMRHMALEFRPPAMPVLLDEKRRVAGLQVDGEIYRAAYFPFDLSLEEWTNFRPVFESSLLFLHQQVADVVQLEISGGAGEADYVLSGDDTSMQLRVSAEVEGAEMLVFSLPQYDLVDTLVMERVSTEGEMAVFETAVRPPDLGLYLYLLRLQTPSGQVIRSSVKLFNSTKIGAESVLVILDERYDDEQRQRLQNSFAAVLGELGLEFSMVELFDETEGLHRDFLSQFHDEGDIVIWLGRFIDIENQQIFREYLEGGGNLLVASFYLSSSLKIGDFLQELLHVTEVGSAAKTALYLPPSDGIAAPLFSAFHRVLKVEAAAEPVLLGEKGEIAGVRVEDIYKAVYLSIDLFGLDQESQRLLLASQLEFLLPQQEAHLHYLLSTEIDEQIVQLEPWIPQVTVVNGGNGASQPFRASYQIIQDGQVLVSVLRDEAPLEGQSRRLLDFPAWLPPTEGRYEVLFGMSAGGDSLIYQAGPHRAFAQVPPPFVEVELPGETDKGNGADFFDYDGDGDLDLLLVRRQAPSRLWRNDGDGFSEQSEAAGLRSTELDRGLAFGDYDGDGDLDLYLVTEQANLFFGNEGDGTFVEIADQLTGDTTAVGLADAGSGRSAGFFDADRDGDLDLYVVNASGVNRFYNNDGGRYGEWAAGVGLADEGNGRGLALGDFDGDGATDVFVANTAGGSRLWRNEATGFVAVEEELGLDFSGNEVAAAFGDYDGDGRADLLVANEGGANQLFVNEGTRFRELTGESLDLGQRSVGATWWDYDNDGDLDISLTALSASWGGDEIYHHHGEELLPVGPLLALTESAVGRGMSAADFDGDGHLDLLVADVERSRLYRSQGVAAHWLAVVLQGVGLNRYGLGAKVEVVAGAKRWLREVQSGYGYASQVQPWVHFGLGDVVRVDSLNVIWPDGRRQVIEDVPVDQQLAVDYSDVPTQVALLSAALPATMQLWPNYPNPFNSNTVIRFAVPQAGEVELAIYNLVGQRLVGLVTEALQAGVYTVHWDGRDAEGRAAASGLYIYQLRAGERTQRRKLLLLR